MTDRDHFAKREPCPFNNVSLAKRQSVGHSIRVVIIVISPIFAGTVREMMSLRFGTLHAHTIGLLLRMRMIIANYSLTGIPRNHHYGN